MVNKINFYIFFSIFVFLLIKEYVPISQEIIVVIAFLIILSFLKESLTRAFLYFFKSIRSELLAQFHAAFVLTRKKFVVSFKWAVKEEQILSLTADTQKNFVGVNLAENFRVNLEKILTKSMEENLSLTRTED
jgi:hypothetical protein